MGLFPCRCQCFAVFLCDTLCLTPVMGCAHMDDHRACRVTSVHTLSTTTKRTENNKWSAVAMWMVRHKHNVNKTNSLPAVTARPKKEIHSCGTISTASTIVFIICGISTSTICSTVCRCTRQPHQLDDLFQNLGSTTCGTGRR